MSGYQTGEGIYDLFDRAISSGLFRTFLCRNTADYLTGCNDPDERQFPPGRYPILESSQGPRQTSIHPYVLRIIPSHRSLTAAGAFTRVSVIFAYHVVLRFEHARKTALLDIGLTDSMPPSFSGRIEDGLTRISLICGDAYVVRIVLCFLFQLIRVLSIESHSVSGVLFGNFPGLRSVLVSDVFRSRFSCEDILCYLLRAKRAYRYGLSRAFSWDKHI